MTANLREIESGVTKKLSKEFSKTESRILDALSRRNEFLLNPLILGHSKSAPGTSQNTYGRSQGTNEDDSESDSHPEAGIPRTRLRKILAQMIILYYIADLPLTSLRSPSSESENIPVPFVSLRSLILLLSSSSFAFFDSLLRSSWDARLRLA